jgi:prepilin-type N-terminal cleavage/methylation domain-containing protein
VFKLYRDLLERKKEGESSESGFTLIELLIVIVVLGILAAIVIFSLTGVTGQSQVAACNSDAIRVAGPPPSRS